MGTGSIRTLREELPAQGAWVKRLARGLVRDEASADDLAQETALAALRRGDSIRGALEPWLARVTRNFARRGWREAARRAARERGAARPEAQPGADEAAARLEVQRRLVEELSALDAPLRHALVRRYFDGWSAARIARASGEPAPTVRWRLQRGLAELRARLDRKSGGDGLQWRLALLPLCGSPMPWPAAARSLAREALRPFLTAGALQGALTMKAATQALAAVTLVAAVGLGVWWNVDRAEAPREGEPAEPGARGVVLRAPAESVDAPPAAPPAARESLALAVVPQGSEPGSSAPAKPGARLGGRVVDERLVPVAGASVVQLDVDGARPTRAGADGSFELEVTPPPWRDCTLRVEAEGFASAWVGATLQAAESKSLGDVVLAPGGSLRGRVLGPDGAPFEGASVTVTRPDLWGSLEDARASGPSDEHLTAVSEADGRFVVAGVAVGPMRAWAGAQGMRYAVSPPIEVRAHATTDEVELRLEPVRRNDRIAGRVLAPDGAAVPDARVGVEEHAGAGRTDYTLSSDAQGRFALVAKGGRTYDLRASVEDERWPSVQVKDVACGREDVELRFQESRWIEVDVRAPEGTALADFAVLALASEEHRLAEAKSPEHSGERGHARLQRPTESFFVRVDARGFRVAERGPFAPEEAPPSLAFELVPEPGIRGRVLAGGAPLAGARVTLHVARPDERIEHQGYLSRVDPNASDAYRTDADGRFTLKLRAASTYVVRAEADGWAPSDSGPLELAPETGRDGLELVLGHGGSLEGRVRVAPGRDPAGVIVALNRGDAFPRTMRSDAEGLFGFEGLTPGPWQLARGRMDFNPEGGSTASSIADAPVVIPFNCTVTEGETTYQDLDLTDFEPCVVMGVLRVNGAPAASWGVVGWPGGVNAFVGELPSTATAADGSFTLTLDDPGALRLSFSPPAEAGGRGRLDVRTEVHPGKNEWRSDFVMGRLSGRCLSALAGEQLRLSYSVSEGVEPACWLAIEPDENGRYALPFVPAGRGMVRRFDGGTWTTLVETEVIAQRERVLDVP